MPRALVILLAALMFKVSAQFNDSIRYHLAYTSAGNYNRTNTNSSYLLSNVLNFGTAHHALKSNFQAKWLYGEQQRTLVNNDYSGLFDLNLYKTFPHFYYWLL